MSYRVETPQDFIQGLRLSWVSVTQVTIGAGRCADSNGRQLVRNTSSLTVDITASGAGGLDTGSEAGSTWYAVYLIAGPTGIAGLLSTSATTPTKPAGYSFARRIGWIRNDSSLNLEDFVQGGNGRERGVYSRAAGSVQLILDTGANNGSYAEVDCSSRIPSSARIGIFRFQAVAGAANTLQWRPTDTGQPWGTLKYGTYQVMTGTQIPVINNKSFEYKTWGSGGDQSKLSAWVSGWEETL